MNASIGSVGMLPSDLGGEEPSCLGIDIQPLGSTPAGELVRIDVCADHAKSFCLKAFASLFGGPEPLIVGPRQFVAVLENRQED